MFGDYAKIMRFTADPESLYTCYITSCNITDRESAISAFKGKHKATKNNDSVKALCIHDTKLHYIPKNLAKIFPNLVILSINKSELKEITAEDLTGLEKLQLLDLENNDITNLPEDLFKNMKNLKEASFSDNLIQSFDTKICEPIRNTIESFRISRNPGIDEAFNENFGIDDFIQRLNSKKVDSQRFGDLFTSGKHSDFTIKVLDKEFRVHKGILASLSSVFDKMFSDDALATSKTYDEIGNFGEEATEEFLRYFYTRTLPNRRNAAELLKLALEFDVPDLKLKCEDVLVQTINPDSARELFNLAVQKSLPKLKRKSFEVIQKSHPDIGDYIYDKTKLVNQLIDAQDEFKAKKIKLEKE